MDSFLGHLQINIDPDQIGFYKDFFSFLNWKFIYEDQHAIAVLDKHGSSVWFIPAMNEARNDYDGVGMNHLAIGVSSPAEVDQAAAWLTDRGIPALFETPRQRLDFADSENEVYYQVMFETPDKVLLEVVYYGPKQVK
jgi:catechol 2,3-dioxygenase-like lactoylglutathione lyase family enzyme